MKFSIEEMVAFHELTGDRPFCHNCKFLSKMSGCTNSDRTSGERIIRVIPMVNEIRYCGYWEPDDVED